MSSTFLRFAAVRAATPPSPDDPFIVRLADDIAAEDSDFRRALRGLGQQAADRAAFDALAADYANGDDFVRDLQSLGIDLDVLVACIDRLPPETTATAATTAIEKCLDASLPDWIRSDEVLRRQRQLEDSLLAAAIGVGTLQQRASIVHGLRALALVDRLSQGHGDLPPIGSMARRLVLALPRILTPPPSEVDRARRDLREQQKRQQRDAQKVLKGRADLTERLRLVEAAIDELSVAYARERRMGLAAQRAETAEPGQPATPRRRREGRPGEPEGEARNRIELGSDDQPGDRPADVLSAEATSTLTERTVSLLGDLGIERTEIEVAAVTAILEERRHALATRLYVGEPSSTRRTGEGVALFGGRAFGELVGSEVVEPSPIPGPCPAPPPEPAAPSEVSVPEGMGVARTLGVADLMIVRQRPVGYELGDVAHVENVLQGEAKERTHRTAREQEETVARLTETVEELERDLQTAERFGLENESTRTVFEDLSFDAGVLVTAKYGPYVEVEAATGIGSEQGQESSRRAASSYARDVTDRTVSRVRQQKRVERIRFIRQSVEETNRHTVDNAAADGHVIGVYRWIDQLFDAQVLNYGKRLLFEFVLPEPAALLRRAIESPETSYDTAAPDPPGYCRNGKFVPLAPKDLTESNYLFWVGKYGVGDVDPPPPRFRTIATALDAPPTEGARVAATTKSSTELKAPPGYAARRAWINGQVGVYEDADAAWVIAVGRRRVSIGSSAWLDGEDATVPFVFIGLGVPVYALTVEVVCERSTEALEAWQIATFNAIMTAYRELQAEFEAEQAERETRLIGAIEGRNPAENRVLERNELKRLVISMASGQHFDAFDAMRRRVAPHGYPQLDVIEADAEGRFVQFFEQAFEWSQMAYVFYPYFWGRKEDWLASLSLTNPDPLFLEFLRAGAARVQVPARPGFEDAVLHYLEFGNIWEGGEPPHVDDPAFLSLVDELRGQQAIDREVGAGRVTLEVGSTTVLGVDTAFTPHDRDREITIAQRTTVIAEVISGTEIRLVAEWPGPAADGAAFELGAKHVGPPWVVRIPTSLVYLQPDSALPTGDS